MPPQTLERGGQNGKLIFNGYIVARHSVRQLELQTQANKPRGVARPMADLVDAAPCLHSRRERGVACIAHEAQGVEEVALARAIEPDQDVQRSQADIAKRDALIVLYDGPCNERRDGRRYPERVLVSRMRLASVYHGASQPLPQVRAHSPSNKASLPPLRPRRGNLGRCLPPDPRQ